MPELEDVVKPKITLAMVRGAAEREQVIGYVAGRLQEVGNNPAVIERFKQRAREAGDKYIDVIREYIDEKPDDTGEAGRIQ